jgi:hypothetical protein
VLIPDYGNYAIWECENPLLLRSRMVMCTLRACDVYVCCGFLPGRCRFVQFFGVYCLKMSSDESVLDETDKQALFVSVLMKHAI